MKLKTSILLIKTFDTNYDSFLSKYLMSIKAKDDDRFDMLADKNFKFLFYHFNDWLDMKNGLFQSVMNNIINEDEKGLVKLQFLNWSYFIK